MTILKILYLLYIALRFSVIKIEMIILPNEIKLIIFEFLRFDRHTLFSCVLMNRASSELAISLLWKNPFMIDNNVNQYQLALLIRTYMACLTDIEKNYLENKCIMIRNFQKPIFDYACYLEKILYSEPVHDSILYWILSEYRNYTKE